MVDPMTTDIAAPAPRRRAYLDRLGDYTPADEYPTESDELGRRVPVQRARYGFDERQTWSLDYTMVELLFERLCMFQDLNFWQQTDGEIRGYFAPEEPEPTPEPTPEPEEGEDGEGEGESGEETPAPQE